MDRERLADALERLRDAGARGVTKLELSRALGDVSVRSVDRALGLLESQGAVLERTRTGKPRLLHFRLLKGPDWDEHVSTEARLALRLASLSLSQSGTLLWQDKLATIEALASDRMSSREQRLFEQLQRSVRLYGGVEDPIEAPEILEPILRALEASKEVEVDYQPVGGKGLETKQVVPYALTHDLYSGGAFLLVWDPARGIPLHLRLNRIAAVRVLQRPGVLTHPEALENAARYQIGGWTTGEPPFEVAVRIFGAHWVQAFKEAPPALPEFQAIPDPDGQAMTVTFKANHEKGPTRWILQFGSAAEVLRPEPIRRAVAEHLERAASFYRATGTVQPGDVE